MDEFPFMVGDIYLSTFMQRILFDFLSEKDVKMRFFGLISFRDCSSGKCFFRPKKKVGKSFAINIGFATQLKWDTVTSALEF